jgi:hypothetical protein
MEDRFPDAACGRCGQLAQLNTVPLRLIPAGAPPWQSLCDACFRDALGEEPTDSQKMRPIQHGRPRRR